MLQNIYDDIIFFNNVTVSETSNKSCHKEYYKDLVNLSD